MNIEFIEYSGHFPNLCSGVLILRIDGVIHSFGTCAPYDDPEHEHPSFWMSGGSASAGFGDEDDIVEQSEWLLEDEDKLPDFLKPHASELINIMNENVPWGCCGGCI